MNNEEKILALLEALTADIANVKSDISELKVAQAEQGKQLSELTIKVDRLEKKMDYDVIPYLKFLDEDQSSVAQRVTALERAK